MLVGPAAHGGERTYKRLSESGEGVFDSEGLGVRDAPRDQSGRFEVAQRSSQHSLRDVSQPSSEFAVAMRFPAQHGQDLRRPLANEDRRDRFRRRMSLLLHVRFKDLTFFQVRGPRENRSLAMCLCLDALALLRFLPCPRCTTQAGTPVYLLDARERETRL